MGSERRSDEGRKNDKLAIGLLIGSHSLLKNEAEVLGEGSKDLMGSWRNRLLKKCDVGDDNGDLIWGHGDGEGAADGSRATGLAGTRGDSGLSHSELVWVLE